MIDPLYSAYVFVETYARAYTINIEDIQKYLYL